MELRRDPLNRVWVIMAPDRAARPGAFLTNKLSYTKTSSCPFCPGNEVMTPKEILSWGDSTGWKYRVFPNKYPALKVEGVLKAAAEDMNDQLSGIGAHEVIVYTSEHTLKLEAVSPSHMQHLFGCYKERVVDLQRDFRFAYIHLFENKGILAGATLEHPHAQVLAVPVIPNNLHQKIKRLKSYYYDHNRCLICDTINSEVKANLRIIFENNDFIAYCPYASPTPFYISILPKRHMHNFIYLNSQEVKSFADITSQVFNKLGKLLEEPDYNAILHNSPTDSCVNSNMEFIGIGNYYHWHFDISPKISLYGGSEISGTYINTVLPEEAASMLRA